MAIERTFSMVKPDGTSRNLIGEVLRRYENANLRIVALRYFPKGSWKPADFYKEHEGKAFYDGLVEYMSSDAVVAIAVEGENAVARVREIIGATNPAKADKGTIRGDFGLELPMNTVHASDSTTSAAREIGFFFAAKDLA